MARDKSSTSRGSALNVRLGRWFEARATGWGILVLPVLAGLALFLVLAFATS